jgi:phenylacetaldehyde dehydrogenase
MTPGQALSSMLPHDIDGLRSLLRRREPRLFINGNWCTALSNRTLEVHDPATGQDIAVIADGNEEDIDVAVTAARRAFGEGAWPQMSGSQRAALIHALADCIAREEPFFCLLESLDAGHAISSITKGDFPLALRHLREMAGSVTRLVGEVPMLSPAIPAMDYYLREPIGVVGIITPWNAPFLMVIQKLAAVLATGCTAVIKPAELAPLSALYIAETCARVGIPPGVVNVVTGRGAVAGQALADHHEVNLISFTGSTGVGKSIMQAAGRSNLKRLVLELGGKSPVIVLADANIHQAAKSIASEIAFKSGQYCAAGTRLFVQASVHDALLDRLRAQLEALRIGPGYAADTDMGPMISFAQRSRADEIVNHSVKAGATALCGGRPRAGSGYYYEPTVLIGVRQEMRAMREEIFAPVISVMPFSDEMSEPGIAALANDSDYGLSAKIWARDVGAVHGLIRRLQTGQVIVNGGGGDATLPFGGVKQSGYGRENGREGMAAYTETKAVRLGYGS